MEFIRYVIYVDPKTCPFRANLWENHLSREFDMLLSNFKMISTFIMSYNDSFALSSLKTQRLNLT